MKKRILILTLSDLRYDARVRRQVQALKDDYSVTLAGFNGEFSNDYELITLSPTPLTFWRKAIASVFLIVSAYNTAHRILHNYLPLLKKKTHHRKFDLIIANDIETLPLAFSLQPNPLVFFDAHEYAPRHFEDKLMWRIFFKSFNIWLCKKYLKLTAAMTTVSNGLAKEYQKHFYVEPVVIPNANNYFELQPSPVVHDRIRLVHVGIATPSRKLELMIDMMNFLDGRFTLDLYLLVPGFASNQTKNYIGKLQQCITNKEIVRILPPVKSTDVVKTLNNYDIGVFLLPPINFNYANTLPNKLFDFIQARIGVAIGPTPEMAEIVSRFGNGIISENFTPQALAEKLNDVSMDDIIQFKKNSAVASRFFNAENNAITIKKMIGKVISK